MRFNLVIGNPPYQESDGSGLDGGSAIYDKFIIMSDKVSNVCAMIIPMRWMVQYKVKGISPKWAEYELHSRHYKELRYSEDSTEVFNGVRIRGGVMYFLRDKAYVGPCKVGLMGNRDVKVEDNNAVIRELASDGVNMFITNSIVESVLLKIQPYIKNKRTFRDIVGTVNEFGIESNVCTIGQGLKLYKSFGYVCNCGEFEVQRGKEYISMYKVIVNRAFGKGKYGERVPETRILGPNEVCSGSFIIVAKSNNKVYCENVSKYMRTKFMSALVGIRKSTHNATRDAYQFVPLQDFTDSSDIDWSKSIPDIDRQLYKKYGFTKDEIEYIENTIK